MSNLKEIEIQNIDHLGIVAGIIDSIDLVEIVNKYCGQESGEKISPGHVVDISENYQTKFVTSF